MYSEEDTSNLINFLLEILEFVEKINQVDEGYESNEIFNAVSHVLLREDIYSIDICKQQNSCFVIDDLFVGKITKAISSDISLNNFFGLLLAENLLNLEEILNLIEKLLINEYLSPVNSSILQNIVLTVYSNQDNHDLYQEKLKKIIDELISPQNKGYYVDIIKELTSYLIEIKGYSILLDLFGDYIK